MDIKKGKEVSTRSNDNEKNEKGNGSKYHTRPGPEIFIQPKIEGTEHQKKGGRNSPALLSLNVPQTIFILQNLLHHIQIPLLLTFLLKVIYIQRFEYPIDHFLTCCVRSDIELVREVVQVGEAAGLEK